MAREKLEIWENRNRSEIWVQKEDSRGRMQPVRVAAGQRIELSSYERQRNQEQVFDRANDWFSNGALSVIELLDTAEDYEEIKSNPNSRSESEIRDLLQLHANDLKRELAAIDSPFVVQRLKELVEEGDDENLTVAKSKAVKARYDELHPRATGKVFDSYEEAIKHKTKI